jgi:phosphotransferase family enzyme
MTSRSARALDHPDVSSDLRWLAGLLWGSDARVRVVGARETAERGADRFALVGGAAKPRFLVPLVSEAAAAASLRTFNALRPPVTRAFRRGLAAALRVRMDRVVVPDHLVVEADSTPASSLQQELGRILGHPHPAFAVGIGAAGPNRKPTLQVVSETGTPLAFVKVGWNDFTRGLVRREAAALRSWGRSTGSGVLGAPELIHAGPWNGFELSVIAPLPSGVRRHRPSSPTPLEATLDVAHIDDPTTTELAESDYVRELRDRLRDMVANRVEEAAIRALDVLEERAGERSIAVGVWHGDWTPWNLAWDGGRLYAIDWEHWGRAPLGFDLLHYAFATAFFARRRNPDEAASALRRQGVPRLAGLGVPEPLASALAGLYLLELLARSLEARRGGAGTNRRLLPALFGTIDDAVRSLG